MNAYDKIAFAGISKAEEYGITRLKEKIEIPFLEDIAEDFINTIIDDLNEFLTLEQYPDAKRLYELASLYTFGKGAEFALSFRLNTPLNRIGYDFNDCMQSNIGKGFPESVSAQISDHSGEISEVFYAMYKETSKHQYELISNGISFNNCLFRMLSGTFFLGRKVGLSLEIENTVEVDFSANDYDVKYDYDSYDQSYN